jgi:hypothetical protein
LSQGLVVYFFIKSDVPVLMADGGRTAFSVNKLAFNWKSGQKQYRYRGCDLHPAVDVST